MSIESKFRRQPLSALVALVFGASAGFAHAADTVTPAPTTAPADTNGANTPTTPAAQTPAASADAPTHVLTPVHVEGKGNTSYVSKASVGGKEERSLKEIPGSVSVITQERIKEQNLVTVADALIQTPGITVIANDTTQSQYWSRGYSLGLMNDGIPTYGALSGYQQIDLAILERVEVLRGPSGLFQGSSDLGGSVNLVRKRGQDTTALESSVTLGSWNQYRAVADVTGPLNEDKTVRGRAVVVAQNRHYFYDRTHNEKYVAYGDLDWDITPSDTVSLALTYQNDITQSPYSGLPASAVTGALLNVSRSTNPYPDWTHYHWDTKDVIAEYEHRFNSDWKLRARLISRDQGFYFKDSYPTDGVSATGTLPYARRAYDYEYHRDAADLFVAGKFALLGRTHELIAGYNFDRYTYDYEGVKASAVNGVPFGSPNLVPNFFSAYNLAGDSSTEQTGFYTQLRLSLADPLTAVVGGRLSDYYAKSRSGTPATVAATFWKSGAKTNDEFTPNGALVYDVSKNISAYLGYAEIFVPTSSLKANGQPLDPRRGEQYELGSKGEFFDGKLIASLAVFRLNDVNRAYADAANPGFYLNRGKVESKGWEAEVSGSPARGWNLQAGYTRLDTIYAVDKNNQGLNWDTWEPRHTFKFWGTHDFSEGKLTGLSVGLGSNIVSGSMANNGTASIRRQGGYAVWNAYASYPIAHNLSLQFNANNLFDRTYYTRLGGTNTYNTYGDPRNFSLTLRAKF